VKSFWLTAACVALVISGCKRESSESKPAANPTPIAAVADAGPLTAELPTPRPEDLPGFPIEELPEPAQKQLFAFAQDDFCYCGCPHTVQACLKEHKACRHAKRMMLLAASDAMSGAKSAEISTLLNTYYGSFAPEKRFTFDLANAACQGPETAPVTLVEFSDFECPYCALARPMLEQLVASAKGQVRLCFKPFPLQVHPHSGPAAEAAMFARSKGKFWEMHDLLFQNQQSLEENDLRAYASRVGLDPDELVKAVRDQRFAAEIDASKEEGKKAGVQGTPSIYVNGRPLVLPVSTDTLAHAIQDELEWKQNGGHWTAD
jgi:protein-disulfide isomerase